MLVHHLRRYVVSTATPPAAESLFAPLLLLGSRRQPRTPPAQQRRNLGSGVSDPYADGKYERPDGSPVDITSKLTKGSFGYDKNYAANYDRVFGTTKEYSTSAEKQNNGDGDGDDDDEEAVSMLYGAYSSQSPEDNKNHYAKWAATYDQDLQELEYVLPVKVAEEFSSVFSTLEQDGPILDVGAGTGQTATALRGFLQSDPDQRFNDTEIHGTDISSEMLKVAESKVCSRGATEPQAVYDKLFVGDLTTRLPCEDGVYGGALSSGTFSLGHLGPEPLEEVVRVVRKGGLVGVSVNNTHWKNENFEHQLEKMSDMISDLEIREVPICAPGKDDHPNGFDVSKMLLFRKR